MSSEGKFVVIRSQMSSLVLEVQDGEVGGGQPVVTGPYSGGDTQLWYGDPLHSVIRSLHYDYVLEMQGNALVLSKYDPDEDNQKWRLDEPCIRHVNNDSLVLDIAAYNSAAGARVCSWEHHGQTNQLWTFERAPARPFTIASKMNGKVIEVKHGHSSAGTKIVMMDAEDDTPHRQLWWEDATGNIHSKLNDLVLHGCRGSVRLEEPEDEPERVWVRDGARIVNRAEPGTVLEIKGGKDKDGAKVVATDEDGDDEHQQWDFHYV